MTGSFDAPVLGIFPSLHGTFISFMGWLMHSTRFSKHLKVGVSVASVLSGAFPSSREGGISSWGICFA